MIKVVSELGEKNVDFFKKENVGKILRSIIT